MDPRNIRKTVVISNNINNNINRIFLTNLTDNLQTETNSEEVLIV